MPGWFERERDRLYAVAPESRRYAVMREMATGLRRAADAGVGPPPANAPVWGAIIETRNPGQMYTLLVLLDGTASLYIRPGGAFIGGGVHASVRRFSAGLLAAANRVAGTLPRGDGFPVPDVDHTRFHLLTEQGTLTGDGTEKDLIGKKHPLSPLFYASLDLIEELFRVSGVDRADPRLN